MSSSFLAALAPRCKRRLEDSPESAFSPLSDTSDNFTSTSSSDSSLSLPDGVAEEARTIVSEGAGEFVVKQSKIHKLIGISRRSPPERSQQEFVPSTRRTAESRIEDTKVLAFFTMLCESRILCCKGLYVEHIDNRYWPHICSVGFLWPKFAPNFHHRDYAHVPIAACDFMETHKGTIQHPWRARDRTGIIDIVADVDTDTPVSRYL